MKFCLKSFATGAIVATVGVATVFAVGGIKSVAFNNNKVVFEGQELNLGAQPMVSLVKEGETNASNYMPVRAVLEQMGYDVRWDGEQNTVYVAAKPQNAELPTPVPETKPLAEFINGYWISSDNGVTTKYMFDKSTNKFSSELTDSEGKATYMSGKYTIDGTMVETMANTLVVDGMKTMLTEEDEVLIAMEIEIAKDGSSWSWVDENYPMTFMKDSGSTSWVSEMGKHEGINPTKELLTNYWISKDETGEIKLMFDKDGNYAFYTKFGDLPETYEKGTYKISGNKVLFTVTHLEEGGVTQAVPTDEEYFLVSFAKDGKSWVLVDKFPLKFVVDSGSKDWVKK